MFCNIILLHTILMVKLIYKWPRQRIIWEISPLFYFLKKNYCVLFHYWQNLTKIQQFVHTCMNLFINSHSLMASSSFEVYFEKIIFVLLFFYFFFSKFSNRENADFLFIVLIDIYGRIGCPFHVKHWSKTTITYREILI